MFLAVKIIINGKDDDGDGDSHAPEINTLYTRAR